MTRRHVAITGANRGLGLEVVRQCVARGDVVWAGCRRPEAAVELSRLADTTVLGLDVTDPAGIVAFGDAIAVQTDHVDLLVNNAGANGTAFGADVERSGVLDLAPEPFMAQMRLNALGPMLVVRALLPLLRAPTTSTVVNVSSQLGSLALGHQMLRDIGYNASKAALNMITAALRGTLGAEGITAVAIHPGWVRTDMGGAEAPLTAKESVTAMLRTIDGLASSKGDAFLNWDGTPHPW